jgi:4-nitrophenyl phosphatase/NagD protein
MVMNNGMATFYRRPRKTPQAPADARCFLVDMDGTFLVGDRLQPGAVDFISVLRRQGKQFLFLTNNSSKNAQIYADKITRLGVPLTTNQVFTTCEATALYLQSAYPTARPFVFGTAALEDELLRHGFPLETTNPDLVVLGFDTTFTYDKTWKLCDFVRAGLPYIATHPDDNCPVETGLQPDIGAMIAYVRASTGQEPDVIVGKPNKTFVEAAARKMGTSISEMVMVGDRLRTDMALGYTAGITTVLLLSGETRAAELESSPFQPDFVFDDIGQLAKWLARHDQRGKEQHR